ncbi:MAG: hypothetical protein UH081_05205 [Clostridia bacterium]|nr:hypothetical protein [Clostridia bacterium]
MTKTKKVIFVSTYALLIVGFFFGGYALGNNRNREVVQTVSEQAVPVIGDKVSTEIYYLILNDGILDFYSIVDGEKSLIASENISENIYPTDDMRDLKNGVTFDNIEDAQALFENFVS